MKKQNERIFRLIRQEDVVLWVGAGFSMYAGYPSGGGLVKEIYKNLSQAEIKQIGKNLALDILSEQFVRLRNNSRNELNKILLENFDITPKQDLLNHKLVVQIPHFKHIITTNYDRLFETAYPSNSLSICLKDENIPYLENNKVALYKIHGCISDMNTITLTKSDYQRFYATDYSSPFWASIINLLSTKSILFVGYGNEDSNVWHLFDEISKKIGDNGKEKFLIVPKMNTSDVNHWQKKGITVLKQKAEDFFNELHLNILDNITQDITKNHVSIPTFNSFLSSKSLSPTLRSINGKSQIVSVKGMREDIYGKLKLTLKTGTLDSLFERFEQDNIEEIQLSRTELKEFDFRIADVRFLSVESLDSIVISSTHIEEPFDISFPNVDFELRNLKYHFYRKGTNRVKVIVFYGDLSFDIILSFEEFPRFKVNMNYKIPSVINDVAYCLDFFKLLHYLKRREKMDVYLVNRKKHLPEFSFNQTIELDDNTKFFIDYLSLLKKIEKHYRIRFKEVTSITNDDFKMAQNIVFSINRERQKVNIPEGIELSGVFDEEGKRYLSQLQLDNKGADWRIAFSKEIVTLHNLEFDLGSKIIEINNSKISNIDDILNEKTNTLNMIAEDSTMSVYYTDEKDEQIT